MPRVFDNIDQQLLPALCETEKATNVVLLVSIGAGLCGPADSREITYYNGRLGSVFAFYGPERSVRFHPPDFALDYPFSVSAVMTEFYVGMGSFQDSVIWFKVYAEDGQTLLFQTESLLASSGNPDSVYQLSTPVQLDSGDFWVSLLSRTTSPWAKPYINYDDNPAPQQSFYGSPGAWQQWTEGGEYYLSAFVDTGSGTAVAEPGRGRVQSRVRLPPLAVPNPFAQRTTFRYTLEQAGELALDICNSTGRLVRRLNNGIASPGTHEAVWAGLDAAGRNVPEGIYFCRLSAGGVTASVKLVKSAN
jgi:hypothetical protein